MDIKLVPTEELITELLERCKPAVFIGTRPSGVEGPVNFWEANGNRYTCYGMCHELALNIQVAKIKEELHGED